MNAVNNHPTVNSASLWMSQYFDRQRLAKLGYTSNLSDLDEYTANVFVLISTELDKAHEAKSKRKK